MYVHSHLNRFICPHVCGSSATHNSPGNRPSHYFKNHENPSRLTTIIMTITPKWAVIIITSGRSWPKADVVPAAAASKTSGGERLRRDSFLQLLLPCHSHSLLRSWTRGWWKTRAGSLQPGDSIIISRLFSILCPPSSTGSSSSPSSPWASSPTQSPRSWEAPFQRASWAASACWGGWRIYHIW